MNFNNSTYNQTLLARRANWTKRQGSSKNDEMKENSCGLLLILKSKDKKIVLLEIDQYSDLHHTKPPKKILNELNKHDYICKELTNESRMIRSFFLFGILSGMVSKMNSKKAHPQQPILEQMAELAKKCTWKQSVRIN